MFDMLHKTIYVRENKQTPWFIVFGFDGNLNLTPGSQKIINSLES